MSKRILNTSKYIEKSKTYYWRVHFVFILSEYFSFKELLKIESTASICETPEFNRIGQFNDQSDMKYSFFIYDNNSLLSTTVSDVHEETSLSSIIEDFFSNQPDQSLIRHALSCVRKAPKLSRKGFIQNIPSMASNPVFLEISLQDSIKAILEGKTVLEYPTIFVGVDECTKLLPRTITTIENSELKD